jgi:hypothetical protein
MVKKWYFYTSLAVIIALSLGFKPLEIEANQWFLKNTDGIRYLLSRTITPI